MLTIFKDKIFVEELKSICLVMLIFIFGFLINWIIFVSNDQHKELIEIANKKSQLDIDNNKLLYQKECQMITNNMENKC